MQRTELGYDHQEVLNPWQLRQLGCDHFWKLYEDKHPYICQSLQGVLDRETEYENSPEKYYEIQQKSGKYVDEPVVFALANYLNVDYMILSHGRGKSIIRGSLTDVSTTNRPPMVLGKIGMTYSK